MACCLTKTLLIAPARSSKGRPHGVLQGVGDLLHSCCAARDRVPCDDGEPQRCLDQSPCPIRLSHQTKCPSCSRNFCGGQLSPNLLLVCACIPGQCSIQLAIIH